MKKILALIFVVVLTVGLGGLLLPNSHTIAFANFTPNTNKIARTNKVLNQLAKLEQSLEKSYIKKDIRKDAQKNIHKDYRTQTKLPKKSVAKDTAVIDGYKKAIAARDERVKELEQELGQALREARRAKSFETEKASSEKARRELKAKLEDKLESRATKIASLRARVDSLEIQLAEAKTSKETYAGDNERKLSAFRSRFKIADERLQAKESALASLRKEYGALQEKFHNVSNRRQEGSAELSSYRAKNSELKKKLTDYQKTLTEYEKQMAWLKEDFEKKSVASQSGEGLQRAKVASLEKDLSEMRENYQSLETQNRLLKESATQVMNNSESSNRQLAKVSEELKQKKSQVAMLESAVKDLEERSAKLTVVEQEMFRLKNELALKRTEQELLASKSVRTKPTRTLDRPPVKKVTEYSSLRSRYSAKTPAADVMVVEVKESKVNLRSGRGTEHSPVMQVQKGTKLTVESREGEWYRVITPIGTRAYVRADLVQAPGAKPYRSSAYSKRNKQVPAFSNSNSKREDDALRALNSLKAALQKRGH